MQHVPSSSNYTYHEKRASESGSAQVIDHDVIGSHSGNSSEQHVAKNKTITVFHKFLTAQLA